MYRRRSGEETGNGRWRRDTRCCSQDETEEAYVVIMCGEWNVEISKQTRSTSGEMARDDHCRVDDDPPIDGMCHLRLRTPDT